MPFSSLDRFEAKTEEYLVVISPNSLNGPGELCAVLRPSFIESKLDNQIHRVAYYSLFRLSRARLLRADSRTARATDNRSGLLKVKHKLGVCREVFKSGQNEAL